MFEWQNSGGDTVMMSEGFVIANLAAQYGGMYLCIVSNDAGSGNDSITVNGECNL
jgi:hypothetical protein